MIGCIKEISHFETFLLHTHSLCLIEKTDNNHFLGLKYFYVYLPKILTTEHRHLTPGPDFKIKEI